MEETGGYSPRPHYQLAPTSPWAHHAPHSPNMLLKPPPPSTSIADRPAWGAGVSQEVAGALDAGHGGLQAHRAQTFLQNRNTTSPSFNPASRMSHASPYQKQAAQRAAENSIRPWQPMSPGMGEREGATFAQRGPGASSLAHPNLQTSPAAAEAIGKAAGRVARPGTAQVDAEDAWSPVPHAVGRQIWPTELVQPPRYCTGCRGGHEAEYEMNPAWEPYSPADRLRNLNMLETKFGVALSKGFLCAKQNSDNVSKPVLWTWTMKLKDAHGGIDVIPITPDMMASDPSRKEEFISQLVLMYEGLREGHEPYRHLATCAAKAFLKTESSYIVDAVDRLMKPITLGLQTYEPHLVGHMLMMVQALLRSHPAFGPAFRPFLPKILPYLALFRPRSFMLHLPPPFCLPSTGSFAGTGISSKSGSRTCNVCGHPVDKETKALRQQAKAEEARRRNAHLFDESLPQHNPKNPLNGRKSKKYELSQLISDTLDLIVQLCGPGTLPAVQRIIPRYCYFDPQ